MRTFKFTIALLAVVGWAVSADAGTVKKVYNVSDAFGANWRKVNPSLSFTASTVMGTLYAAVSTPSSTFTSQQSNPPVSAWIHMQPSGRFTAMVTFMDPFGAPDWTVATSLKIHVQGSTRCHVASHTAESDTVIPASCHLAGLSVMTTAHCSGNCNALFAPGCWGATPQSSYHAQTWKAKSIHCTSPLRFTHTAKSAHYMKSCHVKLTPPAGHTCGSASASHLASSDNGYHTIHIGAKQK